MVQPFFGIDSINMVSWPIPFELFLPLTGALLYVPASRLPPRFLQVLLFTLLAMAAIVAILLAGGDDRQLMRAIVGLGAGTFLYLAFRRLPRARPRAWPPLIFFVAAVLVMLLAGMQPFLALLFPPLAAAAILYGAGAQGIFSLPPLQALGRWSYSIYLLHIPVLMAAYGWLGEGLVQGNPAAKLALIAATLALSGLCYRFIELPLVNLGRRKVMLAAARS